MHRRLWLVLVVLSAGAVAASEPVGHVKELSGSAFIVSGGERSAAELGAAVFQDDTLETGSDGALGVLFIDDSRLSIGPDTSLTIDEYVYEAGASEGAFLSRLARGTLLYVSGLIAKLSPESANVETPVGTIGIRGTRFLVRLESAAE